MNYKTLTTFMALLISGLTYGQQATTTIPPCFGNDQRSMMSVEQSIMFNLSGINLLKYDWSNPTINCHINSAATNYSQAKKMTYPTYIAIGASVTALASGFSRYKLNKEFGGATPTGLGLLVLGTALTVGTVYTFSLQKKKKAQADYHMGIVGQYYRDNKIE